MVGDGINNDTFTGEDFLRLIGTAFESFELSGMVFAGVNS